MYFLEFFMVFVLSAVIPSWCLADESKEGNFYNNNGPYFVSKEAVNWTDAKQACKKAGLELASPLSEDEQRALENFLIQNEMIPVDVWSGYWLSGMRQEDGNYYWDSTGTKVGATFHGWVWGEPSHAYGRENCVELKFDHISLGWNDYFCDETRRYICEIPKKLKTKDSKKKLHQQTAKKEWYTVPRYYGVVKPIEVKENDDFEKLGKAILGLYSKDHVESDATTISDEDFDYSTQLSFIE